MNEDAPPIAANQMRDGISTHGIRRMTCIYILLLGATLGMLVGILDLLANNRWKIQEDFFDIVDAPIHPLTIHFPSPHFIGSPEWHTDQRLYAIRVALVIICYWTIIGLLLASLICLIRKGVIRDITRDEICRWVLFLGTCGGTFIGSVSFLAASNGWYVLSNFFYSVNQPINSVMGALQERYNILSFLPPSPQTQFITWNAAAVVYWIIICLFMTFIFCVIRIEIKRKAASGASAPE